MHNELTWVELADALEKIKAKQPLGADWLAYVGSENYGLWLIRPDGQESDGARATFSLIAAQIVSKLGITPIPVPKPLQYCPHWELSCKTEEEMARREGKVLDLSGEVPHGLDKVDFDAVDPCTRALLELLRRESRTFQISTTGTDWIKGIAYPTITGEIKDLCETVASFCRRRARDEIGSQLTPSDPGSKVEHAEPECTDTNGPGQQLTPAQMAQQARAETVGKLIRELDCLKPQMFEDEKEYNELRVQYPDFLTFKIAETRPDLKRKVLMIRGSVRHTLLAQELAAAHYGREVSTIQEDWKNFKPSEFRRPK